MTDFSNEEKHTDDFVDSSLIKNTEIEENNENSFEERDDDFIEDDVPVKVPEFYSDFEISPTEVGQIREETRGTLAKIFMFGFFFSMLLGGIFVFIIGGDPGVKVQNFKDVLLAISGVLSGPLGFVVGYYFRKQEEGNN